MSKIKFLHPILLFPALFPGLLFLLALQPSLLLQARENPPAGEGISPGLFDLEEIPWTDTAVELAAWDPDKRVGIIAVTFTYPEGYHQIDNAELFRIDASGPMGFVFGPTLKPEPILQEGTNLPEYFDETTAIVEFQAPAGIETASINIIARFQICNEDGVCLLPDARPHQLNLDMNADSIIISPDSPVQAILDWALSGKTLPPVQLIEGVAGSASPVESAGIPLLLILALAGGFLLNLMPCILPLLSVKALNMVGQSGMSRREHILHALLYNLGIVISFWFIALTVVLLRSSGQSIGWGFQFQTPAFSLAMTLTMWIFALSMFDVYVIQAPQKGLKTAGNAAQLKGYTGSFLTGIFAVLVATPCTAPLLGPAIGFAFSQPPFMIFTIFTLVGLGLGLPFILIGLWPAAINRIPKPGPWMNKFKSVMGFLLVGTALYLFGQFLLLRPDAGQRALWWLLALGFAAWLFGQYQCSVKRGFAARLAGLLSVAIVLLSTWFFADLWRQTDLKPDSGGAMFARAGGVKPVAFEEADFLERLQSEEAIFLEFTAEWCTTCKINKHFIYSDEIQELMIREGITHVVADMTRYNEKLTQWLMSFGRASLPVYVLYNRDGDQQILPTLLNRDILRRRFSELSGTQKNQGA